MKAAAHRSAAWTKATKRPWMGMKSQPGVRRRQPEADSGDDWWVRAARDGSTVACCPFSRPLSLFLWKNEEKERGEIADGQRAPARDISGGLQRQEMAKR
jgi:hypothetical protein